MLLLAVETSTETSSVALVGRGGAVATATLAVPRRHGEFLGPAVAFCLDQAGRSVGDLTGVVVGLGPGLYTGLRVGMAFAQAIAQARRLPIVGLSGLDVMAWSARNAGTDVQAAIDARRGQVFFGRYQAVPGGVQRVGELELGTADDLAADLMARPGEVVLVSAGLAGTTPELDDAGLDLRAHIDRPPLAIDLGMLALPRFEREETQRAGELTPIYLRRVDARIGWQTRGRLQGGAAS